MTLTKEFRETKVYECEHVTFNLWEKYGKSRVYVNKNLNNKTEGYIDLSDGKQYGSIARDASYDDEIADFLSHCTVQ